MSSCIISISHLSSWPIHVHMMCDSFMCQISCVTRSYLTHEFVHHFCLTFEFVTHSCQCDVWLIHMSHMSSCIISVSHLSSWLIHVNMICDSFICHTWVRASFLPHIWVRAPFVPIWCVTHSYVAHEFVHHVWVRCEFVTHSCVRNHVWPIHKQQQMHCLVWLWILYSNKNCNRTKMTKNWQNKLLCKRKTRQDWYSHGHVYLWCLTWKNDGWLSMMRYIYIYIYIHVYIYIYTNIISIL